MRVRPYDVVIQHRPMSRREAFTVAFVALAKEMLSVEYRQRWVPVWQYMAGTGLVFGVTIGEMILHARIG
jgi:hypothetical protein